MMTIMMMSQPSCDGTTVQTTCTCRYRALLSLCMIHTCKWFYICMYSMYIQHTARVVHTHAHTSPSSSGSPPSLGLLLSSPAPAPGSAWTAPCCTAPGLPSCLPSRPAIVPPPHPWRGRGGGEGEGRERERGRVRGRKREGGKQWYEEEEKKRVG